MQLLQNSISLVILCLLSGCSTYRYHKTTERELSSLHTQSKTAVHQNLDWTIEQLITEQDAQKGLTADTAISATILVDPALRGYFEELGIAKADLVQAGFIQNPSISALFQCPRTPRCIDQVSYIDVTGTMNISDFWQIPFKKKVAKDALEIQTVALLQRIINLSVDAQIAYYTYLYEQKQRLVVDTILTSIHNLQENTQENYTAGYASDYDRYVIESTIAQWELKKLNQEQLVANALINLRNSVGLELIYTDIPLTTSWEEFLQPLPTATALFTYAEDNNPELQIAHLKVLQAQHQQSLDRSKIINDVSFGIEYTRDILGVNYIGPILNFDLPIFDQQQAQIERAQRAEKKAHREVANILANVSNDIINLCKKIEISQKRINVYMHHLLPATDQALDYANTYTHTMQMNLTVFLQTKIEMLQQEFNFNKEYLELIKNCAELQKRIGGTIPYSLPTNREEQQEFLALQEVHFREHESFHARQNEG
jgi:cobalt-zinc-cadmium efflux system outer membrane protein